MVERLLIGTALIGLTVSIHAVGSTFWLQFLIGRYVDQDGNWHRKSILSVLISTALFLLMLHVVQVVLWAVTYLALPGIGLKTFGEAFYFSLVTFTTLGYGDITLGPEWRILSGIEAMNGILLFGWTTALLFSVVQRSWKLSHKA
jgi:voltage-gated potassium channel Kch